MVDLNIIKPGHPLTWGKHSVKVVSVAGRQVYVAYFAERRDHQALVYPQSLAYVPGVDYATKAEAPAAKPKRTRKATTSRPRKRVAAEAAPVADSVAAVAEPVHAAQG